MFKEPLDTSTYLQMPLLDVLAEAQDYLKDFYYQRFSPSSSDEQYAKSNAHALSTQLHSISAHLKQEKIPPFWQIQTTPVIDLSLFYTTLQTQMASLTGPSTLALCKASLLFIKVMHDKTLNGKKAWLSRAFPLLSGSSDEDAKAYKETKRILKDRIIQYHLTQLEGASLISDERDHRLTSMKTDFTYLKGIFKEDAILLRHLDALIIKHEQRPTTKSAVLFSGGPKRTLSTASPLVSMSPVVSASAKQAFSTVPTQENNAKDPSITSDKPAAHPSALPKKTR